MTPRLALCSVALIPFPLAAQQWNDSAAIALVSRAVERRALAAADSALETYAAKARGVITFRADLGAVAGLTPRILKADEVTVEVYWHRPDRSKQIIRSWRDTTLFPTVVGYHRDHLGIVTDDLGPSIRIGEGDEVRDVVHPLADSGPGRYQYRIADTVVIVGSSGRLVLVGLEVRPKDPRAAAVIGRLYLDRDRLQVVRSELTFTPAAYLDRELEDITVALERALFEGRYWLPFRQVIEIRRRSAVVNLPIGTVIRGEWTIGDHLINVPLPAIEWAGPSVAGLRRPEKSGRPVGFGPLVDSALAAGPRLEAVRGQLTRLAGRRMLDGLPRLLPAVSRISELLRNDRVEGLVIGAGASWRGGLADELRLGAGYATASGRLTGRLGAVWSVAGTSVGVVAERAVIDVGDFPGASTLVNSIAAQELGRDLADYVERDRLGLRVGSAARSALGPWLAVDWEHPRSIATVARPARGTYRPNPSLGSPRQVAVRGGWRTGREASAGPGWWVEGTLEVGTGSGGYARGLLQASRTSPLWGGQAALWGAAGAGTALVPAWRSFAIGGPGTLLGEPFRLAGGRSTVVATMGWLAPVRAPSLSLGAFGKTSPEVRLGPVVGLGWAGGRVAGGAPWAPTAGLVGSAGVAAELFDRAVRLEFARGWSAGSGWGFTADFGRAFWPVL